MPRRFVAGWTVVAGSVYKAPFAFGQVVSVRSDDADLVEVASAAALTSSGKFYYDVDAAELYVHVGADPATKDIVAGYELYFGTFDAHFFRNPLDDTSRVVYFEPLITQSPTIRQDVTEALFGYMPASSTSLILSNVTAYLTEHLYSSSFNGAALTLYHYMGALSIPNTKAVYRGLVASCDYRDDTVTLRVLDRVNIFDQEYRHVADRAFFDETSFPAIDPQQRNRPIRKVFGVVDGVIAVNYDYSRETDSGVNRYWALHSGTDDPGSVSTTTTTGSTSTRTYLDSADGIRVGDELYFDTDGGDPFYTHVEVTAVNASPAYVEHAEISLGPVASGTDVYRSYIGNLYVLQDGVVTRLPGSCWNEISTAGVLGVEIDHGQTFDVLSRYVNSNDTIYCRVYGAKCSATLGGSPFGADSPETGNLTAGAVLLWELMRGPVGLAEADLDMAAFAALAGNADDELGYQVPFRLGENFPRLRDLVTKLGLTMLLKVYLNDDGKWSVAQTGPLGAAAKSIDDTEILWKRLAYRIDYTDLLSDVFVNYAASEVTSRGQVGAELAYSTARSTSTVAIRLHRTVKQRTFESLHFLAAQAERLADRLRFYFGDRQGRLVLTTKQRFFDSDIADVVDVSRTRMPGYVLDEDVERTRSFAIVGLSKTLNEIELTLDDQKGIEDNAGDW